MLLEADLFLLCGVYSVFSNIDLMLNRVITHAWLQTLKTRSDTYFFAEILSGFGKKWGTNNFLQKLRKEKDNTMKLSSEQKEAEYLYIYL